MDWNVYLLIQKPAYQALLFLLLTPMLIFVIRPKSADMVWVISAYTFGVFLIVNAGLLWLSDSPWHYFFYSIGFAVGYLLIIAIMMPGLLRILRCVRRRIEKRNPRTYPRNSSGGRRSKSRPLVHDESADDKKNACQRQYRGIRMRTEPRHSL